MIACMNFIVRFFNAPPLSTDTTMCVTCSSNFSPSHHDVKGSASVKVIGKVHEKERESARGSV